MNHYLHLSPMRFTKYIALLVLLLFIAADLSLAKGEARFHNGKLSETEISPDIRPMALDIREMDLVKMVRTGPAEAPRRNEQAATSNSVVIPTAVSRTPLKKLQKAQKRHKRKPFRILGGKRQSLALVLSIFLGVLGIHRFYLGYTGIALIQMLTLGGLFVWFIVDAFRIGYGKLVPIRGPYTYRMGNQADEDEAESK